MVFSLKKNKKNTHHSFLSADVKNASCTGWSGLFRLVGVFFLSVVLVSRSPPPPFVFEVLGVVMVGGGWWWWCHGWSAGFFFPAKFQIQHLVLCKMKQRSNGTTQK